MFDCETKQQCTLHSFPDDEYYYYSTHKPLVDVQYSILLAFGGEFEVSGYRLLKQTNLSRDQFDSRVLGRDVNKTNSRQWIHLTEYEELFHNVPIRTEPADIYSYLTNQPIRNNLLYDAFGYQLFNRPFTDFTQFSRLAWPEHLDDSSHLTITWEDVNREYYYVYRYNTS